MHTNARFETSPCGHEAAAVTRVGSKPARIRAVALAAAAFLLTASQAVASGDPDGDTASSLLEVMSDSDPFSAASVPETLFFAIYGTPVCSDAIDNDGDDDLIQVIEGANLMIGGGGNDIIQAFGGTNLLRGGGGDDMLTGGPGQDTLNGGGGTDSCDGGDGLSDVAIPNCETVLNVP